MAYFLTFTCYGTWLHGDERGSKDRHHRAFDFPDVEPDAGRHRRMLGLLRHQPVLLDSAMREAVDAAVRDACAFRSWGLLALNVRTNHVHAVVSADCDVNRVLAVLKARSTRHLVEAGLLAANSRPWTRHGSTRYLWTDEAVAAAVEYVMVRQTRR